MRKVGLVFSHCHWDIEWYMPYHSFRFWLLEIFDSLLRITGTEPGFRNYVLDGQVAPLEHYLAVKPEKIADVRNLVTSGRLSAGPFYTQFDEWLVSPESMVRNCLYGSRQGRKFGRVMKAGYLPDNFGHPKQMPQILAGFGLDSLIFMRGMPDSPEGVQDEFYWEGLDGTKTLCIHLRNGYGHACNPGAGKDVAPEIFRTGPYGDSFIGFERHLESVSGCDVKKGADDLIKLAERAAANYPSGVVPLANGCDHGPPQGQIGDIIDQANRIQKEFFFVHADLEELVKRVKKSGVKFPTFSGDLWGARYQYLLSGTLSTRSYLKQHNFAAESLLEKYAEPLACLAGLAGKAYPARMLEEAWRFLFLNHAHDGIHGSSVDPVHREMIQRFEAARQIALGLCHDSMKYLGKSRPPLPDARRAEVVVYNPVNGKTPELADFWLNTADDDFHIEDGAGNRFPVQTVDLNQAVPVRKNRSGYSSWPEGTTRRVIFTAPMPAHAASVFAVVPGRVNSAAYPAGENEIENEFLKVVFQDGGLDIYDKKNGRWYKGLNIIEDEADAGDAWDFSEPWEDNKVYVSNRFPGKCRLLENGPVRSTLLVETTLRVPAGLAGEKRSRRMVRLPVSSRVSLAQGVRRVEISLVLDNQAKDHRLRLKSPTGIVSQTVKSQGHYGIIERPWRNLDSGKGWTQPAPRTFPFREWVAADDGRCGLAIACRGLYEYEAKLENRRIVFYLTLLRGIGIMSRSNIKSRPGAASASVPMIPEAQCQGAQHFEYAFIPYDCAGARASFLPEAGAFLFPPMTHLVRNRQIKNRKNSAGEAPLFRIEPENLAVSCFKKSEDDGSYILRFWENEGRETLARIDFSGRFAEIYQTNLNESPITKLKSVKGRLEMKVGPYKIITLKLKPAKSVPSLSE